MSKFRSAICGRVAVEQGGEHIPVIARDMAEPFEYVIAFEQTDFHNEMIGVRSINSVADGKISGE